MEEVALRREWRVEREAVCDAAAVRGASSICAKRQSLLLQLRLRF